MAVVRGLPGRQKLPPQIEETIDSAEYVEVETPPGPDAAEEVLGDPR